uniref:Wsv244-like protein n=1 Tax=Melicertus latisulcatus pemonivirus TaxID=2984278 RepID=A0A9C7C662_9VIRU|nr:MAG: wsv244-like protein [Melicertus latisulcatus pemonivirus]
MDSRETPNVVRANTPPIDYIKSLSSGNRMKISTTDPISKKTDNEFDAICNSMKSLSCNGMDPRSIMFGLKKAVSEGELEKAMWFAREIHLSFTSSGGTIFNDVPENLIFTAFGIIEPQDVFCLTSCCEFIMEYMRDPSHILPLCKAVTSLNRGMKSLKLATLVQSAYVSNSRLHIAACERTRALPYEEHRRMMWECLHLGNIWWCLFHASRTLECPTEKRSGEYKTNIWFWTAVREILEVPPTVANSDGLQTIITKSIDYRISLFDDTIEQHENVAKASLKELERGLFAGGALMYIYNEIHDQDNANDITLRMGLDVYHEISSMEYDQSFDWTRDHANAEMSTMMEMMQYSRNPIDTHRYRQFAFNEDHLEKHPYNLKELTAFYSKQRKNVRSLKPEIGRQDSLSLAPSEIVNTSPSSSLCMSSSQDILTRYADEKSHPQGAQLKLKKGPRTRERKPKDPTDADMTPWGSSAFPTPSIPATDDYPVCRPWREQSSSASAVPEISHPQGARPKLKKEPRTRERKTKDTTDSDMTPWGVSAFSTPSIFATDDHPVYRPRREQSSSATALPEISHPQVARPKLEKGPRTRDRKPKDPTDEDMTPWGASAFSTPSIFATDDDPVYQPWREQSSSSKELPEISHPQGDRPKLNKGPRTRERKPKDPTDAKMSPCESLPYEQSSSSKLPEISHPQGARPKPNKGPRTRERKTKDPTDAKMSPWESLAYEQSSSFKLPEITHPQGARPKLNKGPRTRERKPKDPTDANMYPWETSAFSTPSIFATDDDPVHQPWRELSSSSTALPNISHSQGPRTRERNLKSSTDTKIMPVETPTFSTPVVSTTDDVHVTMAPKKKLMRRFRDTLAAMMFKQ